MKNINLLIITNHNSHSKNDSIYHLTQELNKQKNTNIYILSKGHVENDICFLSKDSEDIYTKQIDKKFNFDNRDVWFNSDFGYMKTLEFDVILIRIDRPIKNNELLNLEFIFKNKLIINSPSGINLTRSKKFLIDYFPNLCTNMTLCKNIDDVKRVFKRIPLVLKPLDDGKGNGLIKITRNYFEYNQIKLSLKEGFDYLKEIFLEENSLLAMEYYDNITKTGDKRILIINGEIIGAFLRIPKADSWIANLDKGGIIQNVSISIEEEEIAKVLTPKLKKFGIIIYGFDTIENNNGKRTLSEINTLNVGGFNQINKYSDINILEKSASLIWKYIFKNI